MYKDMSACGGVIDSKVFLILQIGYFKALQQFFRFSLDEVADDVNFIIKKFFSLTEKEHKLSGTWGINPEVSSVFLLQSEELFFPKIDMQGYL